MASEGARLAQVPALFSKAEWARVQALIGELSALQRGWLSGYLAGAAEGQHPEEAAERATGAGLLIAYGSETGNCRALARQLLQAAQAAGHKASVADLASLKPRQLRQAGRLALICSTHGDGEPPVTARDFHEELARQPAGSLPELRFAVLALGDSSYEHFCQTGRELDEHLERAGARRLLPRVDCDVDYEQPAADWIRAFLKLLGPAVETTSRHAPALQLIRSHPVPDRHTPACAEVLESRKLSHAQREDGIWHLALALEPRFPLRPGDALAVLPHNAGERVEEILSLTGLPGDRAVELAGRPLPLREALRTQLDLVIAGKGLLESWVDWESSGRLRAQLAGMSDADKRQWLKSMQLVDLLRDYPARPPAGAFAAGLRPLQPRLYDLANWEGERPEEVELCVRRYRYAFRDRAESGVASNCLVTAPVGSTLRVYPHANPRFHLPADAAPRILVAAGTGIAPYRAFLQYSRREGVSARCWIAFEEDCYREDFLYQREWQEALDEGLVEFFDCSFRDERPKQGAVDCLLEQPERLADWLRQGAHVYLAGERSALLSGERRLAEHLDALAPAGPGWQELNKQGRLHRNLY